jgi:hypothetical protein
VAQVANNGSGRLAAILKGPTGLSNKLAAISSRENVQLGEIAPQHIRPQNVAPELAERTAGVKYPVYYVFCERFTNQLREKFRTFSGKARLVVDVRVTHERLEELGRQLELHAEAVTDVLDSHRGDWGGGIFYTGGYEVTFGGMKHGGKNFIQSAKVAFEVDVSIG